MVFVKASVSGTNWATSYKAWPAVILSTAAADDVAVEELSSADVVIASFSSA
jgi:hypothetical protein